MSKQNQLVDAYSFFDQDEDVSKEELELEDLLVDIACQFIKYRDENGMTQKDLANELQMTQAMVSKLESGEYNPTIKMLFEIARKLSWKFKIEFNEARQKYNYTCSNESALILDTKYCENMGMAS